MDIKKRGGTILSAGLAIIILVLSILPADLGHDQPSFFFPGIDKLVHGLMYLVFTVVVLREYSGSGRVSVGSLVLILTAILAYSVVIEMVQYYFISSRSGELLDVFANLAGILFGLIVVLIIRRFRS